MFQRREEEGAEASALAVGGGSSMDLAKGVAIAATNKDNINTFSAAVAGGTVGVAVAASVNVINTEDALKYLPNIFVRKRHVGDTQAPITTLGPVEPKLIFPGCDLPSAMTSFTEAGIEGCATNTMYEEVSCTMGVKSLMGSYFKVLNKLGLAECEVLVVMNKV